MINYFWIEIKGRNIKRFLTTIFKQKINIEQIKYETNRVLLKVSYEDYNKIKKIKTTYEINIIKTCGKINILSKIKKYKIPITCFITSIFLIIFLSQLILFINIETDNNKIKNIIENSLKESNITVFTFKKSYNKLNNITKTIKNDNLNKIEWIELEQKGVFLNVKVIERIKKETKNSNIYKDIVAKKDGYIKKIVSRKGQVLKNIDDYVKKDEVIISGNIFRNEKVVSKVKASGQVYAEVWYIVKTNENLKHKKMIEQEKGKQQLVLNIQNKEIPIISFSKKIETSKKINLFTNQSFSLYLKKQKKYTIINDKYTSSELEKILKQKAYNHIYKNLKKDEYIISEKTLKKYIKNDRMYIEVFFKTYEDIAKEENLKKIEDIKEDE